jgi:UDP-N-acetylmuramoyl-L-alanyl-D-glutamate--2,6-diaminopimelate ligase
MLLAKLLKNINPLDVQGSPMLEIESLGLSSHTAERGQLFFALRGELADGHAYINEAIKKGAVAVVCERLPETLHNKVCYVLVKDSHEVMGILASAFYKHPSRQLQLIGITGTNGKTTTATLLYRLFRGLGYKAGLLSTVVNYINEEKIYATRTTPDAISLNKLLADMVNAGCTYCFMEVSSHAIVQERIAGLQFTGAVFTNITHDHLDYHKTFDEYIRAKKLFFDHLPDTAFALTNADDKNGRIMLQNTSAKRQSYAMHSMADFTCRIVESSFDGMQLNMNGVDVWTRFIGIFNAYNLLAVYATAQLLLGAVKNETLRLLSAMEPVAGRFEYIRGANDITIIIDYAHTPDALQNVVGAINGIRRNGEQLITVVGCGGNRDVAKRPVMACIAAENSDKVIFTSDNPRFEEPEAILEHMKAGLNTAQRSKSLFIVDREEAIRTAVLLAQPGAIVLIAGKGHENYQEIKGVKTHFDDKEIVQSLLNK